MFCMMLLSDWVSSADVASIEHDDLRIVVQGTRDTQPLQLTARRAPLPRSPTICS